MEYEISECHPGQKLATSVNKHGISPRTFLSFGALIMEEEAILVGLDVGTSKVCALVARVENGANYAFSVSELNLRKGFERNCYRYQCRLRINRPPSKSRTHSGYEINSA